MGARLEILGVATTGSGRELIGELIGADTVNDEITAHKTGATFIGRRYIDRVPDTIFEIGGQDSKFISLEDGVVVDFAMNEACAAGTGSFLEEQAEKLGINIIGEFAELALSSSAPVRLGERCTVFMERDVNSYLQRGADKKDLVAGSPTPSPTTTSTAWWRPATSATPSTSRAAPPTTTRWPPRSA